MVHLVSPLCRCAATITQQKLAICYLCETVLALLVSVITDGCSHMFGTSA